MQAAVDLARLGLPSGSGRRGRRRVAAWLITAAIFVSLLALVPLAFIFWIAVQTGWQTVSALVFRPRVGELLVNTGLLVLLAVAIAITLSVTLALLTGSSNLPGARVLTLLRVAPVPLPAFLAFYC